MKFKEYITEKVKLGGIVSSGRTKSKYIGTIEQLTQDFLYTLEVGASYAKEKGNKKINLKPRTTKALVKELEKSLNNSGNSGYYYEELPTEEEISEWEEQQKTFKSSYSASI